MIIRKALPSEADSVLALYRVQVGGPFCTWDEEYPNADTIAEDMAGNGLYVAEEEGRIIGAISLVPENELDELPFWTPARAPREIARICTAPDCQGRGVGRAMVTTLMDQLFAEGVDCLRLLAAVKNLPARQLYEHCGFTAVGSLFMYGHDYYGMEIFSHGKL